jgi:CheY-like chemotaxis protein
VARHDPLLTVLHVEDDENDALLLVKACERAKLAVALYRVADGEVAREYLLGSEPFDDRLKYPLPEVIVLDLKMPRLDGFEFLKWLRGHESFRVLPVMVFTASLSREDEARAAAEGATSYYLKPTSFEGLVQIVEIFRSGPTRHPN